MEVIAGDCNRVLQEGIDALAEVRWAPTFAFIDQQGVELEWDTLVTLAGHKIRSPYKVELWLLFAHAQLPRGLGVRRATDEAFASRVDRLLGTGWRLAYQARLRDELTPEQLREELTNWMRWRLEQELAYKHTHAFELRNIDGVPVYSMVFATDNEAGNRIMSHLYGQAAERHPRMRDEAWVLRQAYREEKGGIDTLFPPLPKATTTDYGRLYVPAPPHVPFGIAGTD